MKIIWTLFLFSILATNAFAQCDCEKVLGEIYLIVEKNYAGWDDKITPNTKPNLDLFTKNIQQKAKFAKTDAECHSLVKEWLTFFKDGHLRSRFIQPKNDETNKSPLEPLKIEIDEQKAIDYFKKTKNLDAIEGVWKNENYRFAIVRDEKNPNKFNAVILSTKSEIWLPKEVKMIFTKTANSYATEFYEWDKTEITPHKSIVNQNVLDVEVAFYEKEFPSVAKPLNYAEYVYEKDPTNPKLKFPKPDLAVFTLPNMYYENLELVNNLLKKYEKELVKTSYLIIDLRKNEGGNVAVAKPLLPLVYTDPIKDWGMKKKVTKSNVDVWFNSYVKETYDNLGEKDRKPYDDYIADLLKHEGELYSPDKEPFKLIKFAEIKAFPKKVAILIDKDCVSSGELFTLLARQSKKVKIFGENSGGVMDYGDIVPYKTSCPTIRLSLPWTRANWLDEGISIDKNGITPDVKIPKMTKDWIEFTYQNLKKTK